MASADQIYYNGTILTMDKEASIVEAIAIKGDTILAVGKLDDVLKLKNEETILTDLQGSTMLPGFIDAHSHFNDAGKIYATCVELTPYPMGDVKSIEDIKRKLAEKIKEVGAGVQVMGFGYDDTMLVENRHPTAKDLDEISPANPILLSHISFHLGVINSIAMNNLNITKNTPNPEGGIYRQDEDGNPNGVLEETAFFGIIHSLPPMGEDGWFKSIAEASLRYTRKGVTSAQAGALSLDGYKWLYKAYEGGVLKNRVQIFPNMGPDNAEGQNFGGIKTRKSGTQITEDKMLSLGATKTFVDGSIQGFTGYLSKPYYKVIQDIPNKEEWAGYPVIEYADFEKKFIDYHKQGWQIAVHGNGDQAIEFIINAAEAAQKAFPREDTRHIIIHCQTVREDQLDRMKELGMLPAFFPVHTYYWGDRHRDIFLGEERAHRLNPCNSALKRGMTFTSHNDTMVTPIDPLLCIWSAANRITASGKILGAEQCVPVIEAIRSVTSYAAYQAFEEDIKGSLEVGKLADMVILEENPLEIEPQRIKDIKIQSTLVGNKAVYQA